MAEIPEGKIAFEDFAKVELKTAVVLDCKAHPGADKLLLVQVDLGGGQTRQVCAGLRAFYQPEQLIGKQVIVAANLAPRVMRGEISDGMILCATDPATGKPVILSPTEPVAAGSIVK